jgi:hypothetical protein
VLIKWRFFLSPVQTFKNPKPALMAALRESGPVPGDENGIKHKRPAGGEESAKKKKRTDKNVSCFCDMSSEIGDVGLTRSQGRHGQACRRAAEAERR